MDNIYTSNIITNSEFSLKYSTFINNKTINDNVLSNMYDYKYNSISTNNLLNKYYSGLNNKKISSLKEIEYLYENISLISICFFNNNNLNEEKDKFKQKFQQFLNGTYFNGYLDILLIIHEFPNEFNIFDYLNLDLYIYDINDTRIKEQKLMIILRNNIILSLLVVATELYIQEKEGKINFFKNNSYFEINKDEINEGFIFDDLSFLNKLIEQFKNLIIEIDNSIYEIEFDVEVLFLALLGYKNKAKNIKQKHYDYFKNFLLESDITKNFNFDTFLTETVEKYIYDDLTKCEILIFRKILNNAARRKFYFGFEFLLQNSIFCLIISEGRIWKNIGKKMSKKEAFNLWIIYEQNLNYIQDAKFKETLSFEYKNKIISLKKQKKTYEITHNQKKNEKIKYLRSLKRKNIALDTDYFIREAEIEKNFKENMKKIKFKLNKIVDEIKFYFVTSFKELIIIFFKSDLKELVMYFLEEYKKNTYKFKITIEIFDICIEYDESICLDIIDYCVNSQNAKSSYMHIAIIKKYFHLARKLLKYKTCREFLNIPPSFDQDDLAWISKYQVQSKKKISQNLLYKHKENLKYIDFIQERSIQKNRNSESNSFSDNATNINNDNDDESFYSLVNKKITGFKNINTFNQFNSNKSMNNYLKKFSNVYNSINTTSNENLILTENSTKSLNSKFIKNKINNRLNQNSDSNNKNLNNKNDNGILEINIITPFDIKKNYLQVKLPRISSGWTLKNKNDTKEKNDIKYMRRNNIFISDEEYKNPYRLSIDNEALLAHTTNSLNDEYSFDSYSEHNNTNYTAFLNPLKIITTKSNNSIIHIDDNKLFLKKNKSNIISRNDDNNSLTKKNAKKKKSIKLTDVIKSKTHKYFKKNKKKFFSKLLQKLIYVLKNESIDEIKLKKIQEGFFPINAQLILIEALRFGEYVIDVLCLLNSINDNCINLSYSDKIFSNILFYTNSEGNLTKCKEPLLFIAIACEFLMKIGKIDLKLYYKAQTVVEEILNLGENIQDSIKDEERLNYYLKEQFDNKGRNALEIYAENEFYELLNDKCVGNIVEKLWYGEEEISLFNYLRLGRIFLGNIYHEYYDNIIEKNYNEKENKFIFQYSCFIKNCSVRFSFESTIMIWISVYYEYVTYKYINNKGNNKQYQYSRESLFGNFILIAYIINFVEYIIFTLKTGRKINTSISELILVIILIIGIFFTYVDLGEIIYSYNENENNDHYFTIHSTLISTILTVCWIKVFFILMVTYTYGIVIRILNNIFKQFFCFMLIIIAITFCFGQIFTLFFHKSNKDFDYFYNSFLSLFNTCFGQVYFDNFTDLTVFGYTFLICYTTLSNIILFNTIVSLLNNFYDDVLKISDAETRAMFILSNKKKKWDEKYGFLILLPTPLNIFAFPFAIIILIIDKFNYNNIECLCDIFCKFFYIIIAIIYFVYILFLSIILFPLSLLKSYFHFFHDNVIKKNHINSNNKTIRYYNNLNIIKKFFKIPLNLVKITFLDLIYYWKLVYKENNSNDYDLLVNLKEKIEFIIELRRFLCDLRFKERKQIISIYEIYKTLNLFKKKKKYFKKENIKKISKKNNFTDIVKLYNNNNLYYSKIYSLNNNKYFENYNTNNSLKKDLNLNNNDYNKYLFKSSNTFKISNSSQIFYESQYFLEKHNLQENMKENFRYLIDKLIDSEGNIDLDRALALLPYRVKYSHRFIKNLKYLKVRIIINGLRKFLYKSKKHNNFIYCVKKLHLLINKLYIKINMLFYYLSIDNIEKIKNKSQLINEKYLKNHDIFQMFKKKDEESEYDDEGENTPYFIKAGQKINELGKKSSNTTGNTGLSSNNSSSEFN